MPAPASFSQASRIIRSAGQDCGLLQEGSDFTPEQYVDYLNRLNEVIIYEQVVSGLKVWLQYDQTVTLVAGRLLIPFALVVMSTSTSHLELSTAVII